jgi:hypothetical protein
LDIEKQVAKMIISILTKAKKKGMTFDEVIKVMRDNYGTSL